MDVMCALLCFAIIVLIKFSLLFYGSKQVNNSRADLKKKMYTQQLQNHTLNASKYLLLSSRLLCWQMLQLSNTSSVVGFFGNGTCLSQANYVMDFPESSYWFATELSDKVSATFIH